MKIIYLNSSFAEIQPHCQFLASKDIGILGLFEGPFQLMQLECGESCPRSTDFAAARLLGRRNGQIDFIERSISQLRKKQPIKRLNTS